MSDVSSINPKDQAWRPSRFTPRIGGRYDKAIAALRVFLPATAIVVVLATAAYPIFKARETSFVLARNNIAASEDRLRMINPRYSGVDSAQRPFEVRAESAVQPRGVSDSIILTGIGAVMALDETDLAEIKANKGIYQTAEETLEMQAPVLVVTTTGYRIDALKTRVDLDDHIVKSDQRVEAAGPLGVFRANGFESKIDADSLIFTGDVSATLQPRDARLPMAQTLDDGMTAQ